MRNQISVRLEAVEEKIQMGNEKEMNEEKFDAKGGLYSKYRPLYPNSIFEYLISEKIVTADSRVADIGSGTGIFTMQIQPFADTVFAVEPNEDMRRNADAILGKYSNIISINGSAENTGLPSNSVDCITAAQAFHWFERDAFKRECQRILKPGGNVLLLWNNRDEKSEIIQRNAQINAVFCDEYKGFSNGMNFDNVRQFDEFFTGSYVIRQFNNTIQYDLETFVGRNLSSSFAPHKCQSKFEPYVMALEKLFQEFSTDGKSIDYPYIVQCYIGQI